MIVVALAFSRSNVVAVHFHILPVSAAASLWLDDFGTSSAAYISIMATKFHDCRDLLLLCSGSGLYAQPTVS